MSFIASKIIWLFIAPGSLLILLALTAGFLCASHHERQQLWGRRLSFSVGIALFFIGIFPVGHWLLLPLENAFPTAIPPRVDGLILLGGDEEPHVSEKRGQPAYYDSARRYILFATLARQYPQAKLLYSGGSGRLLINSHIKEADVARDALAGLGISVDKIIFEDKSKNTYENALFLAQIVHPNPQQNWLLITSAYHMPRAVGCFRKIGWNVYPAPAGYFTDGVFSSHLEANLSSHLVDMSRAFHEYYGLAAYWLMGYIDSPWPK